MQSDVHCPLSAQGIVALADLCRQVEAQLVEGTGMASDLAHQVIDHIRFCDLCHDFSIQPAHLVQVVRMGFELIVNSD